MNEGELSVGSGSLTFGIIPAADPADATAIQGDPAGLTPPVNGMETRVLSGPEGTFASPAHATATETDQTPTVLNSGAITIHGASVWGNGIYHNAESGIIVLTSAVWQSNAFVSAGELRIRSSRFTGGPLVLESSSTLSVHPFVSTLSSLRVNSELTLGGTLEISPPNTDQIEWGDRLPIIEATAGRNGDFSEIMTPPAPPGLSWVIEWIENTLFMRVRDSADLNDDGFVNFSDLNILLSAYGTTEGGADVDGDGQVGFADLNILLSRFGAHSGQD